MIKSESYKVLCTNLIKSKNAITVFFSIRFNQLGVSVCEFEQDISNQNFLLIGYKNIRIFFFEYQ